MASFKTHIAGAMVTGASISAAGLFFQGLNITQAFAIFIIGAVGGILPDLDSDSGKPLVLIFGVISVLIPALLISKIVEFSAITPELLVSYFVISYYLINSGVCEIIKKITVHRGILHSIPFAFLSGELGYLFFMASGVNIAIIAGIAVFSGCFTHLVLDELHSFKFKFGIIPALKKSSGTALKFSSDSKKVTTAIYSLGVIVAILIITTELSKF